jgi:four helix bundle protein
MREFQALKVWGKAHELVMRVYRITHDFPTDERAGLTEEIRRSARRITAAIVEGCGQSEEQDMCPCLEAAVGAAASLEYGLILARDLGYLGEAVHIRTAAEIAAVRKLLLTALARLQATDG